MTFLTEPLHSLKIDFSELGDSDIILMRPLMSTLQSWSVLSHIIRSSTGVT
jgi:hypothetical protein